MATRTARRIAQDVRALRGSDAMRFSSSRSAGVRTVGLGPPTGLSLGIAGLSNFVESVHATGLRGIVEFYPVLRPIGDGPPAYAVSRVSAAYNRDSSVSARSVARPAAR